MVPTLGKSLQAIGTGQDKRQVKLLLDGAWAGLEHQIGGTVHVENSKQRTRCSLLWETLQCLRRKDDRVGFNYLKDPCAKWTLELRWGIITTAWSALMAWHISLTKWGVCKINGANQANYGELSRERERYMSILKCSASRPPRSIPLCLQPPRAVLKMTKRNQCSGLAPSCGWVWKHSQSHTLISVGHSAWCPGLMELPEAGAGQAFVPSAHFWSLVQDSHLTGGETEAGWTNVTQQGVNEPAGFYYF